MAALLCLLGLQRTTALGGAPRGGDARIEGAGGARIDGGGDAKIRGEPRRADGTMGGGCDGAWVGPQATRLCWAAAGWRIGEIKN